MEVGEEREFNLVSCRKPLLDAVVDWLSGVMPGQNFILVMNDESYTLKWDLPHMTHRVLHGYVQAYGENPDTEIVFPWLVAESAWGKLTVRRVS